jgi:uncharacterized protein (TIGR02265 family)
VFKLDSQPQVSGSLFLARLEFLRSHGGTVLLERVLAQLAPTDAAMLRRPILPGSWYPHEFHLRVDDVIASVVSPDHRANAFIEMGRASADVLLDRRHRRHIKGRVPQLFLEAVPRLYRVHHTVGRREYQRLSDCAGIVRALDGERFVTADDCWTVVGWLQRGLELCGAGTVLVTETSCRAAGAQCCEYRCEWRGGDRDS